MKNIKLRMWIPKDTGGTMVYRGIYDKNWYYHPKECLLFREIKQGDHVFPLMISTGLQDKNGNDIYEGDILKTSVCAFNLLVKWDFDKWGLFDGICNEASIDSHCDEIIGNIYESPELLENKQ